MPTPSELAEDGILVHYGGRLAAWELPVRKLFAFPSAVTWIRDVLPGLQSDGYFDEAPTPSQQLDALFHQFLTGVEVFPFPPKAMEPQTTGVWELRTHDLRAFGWFWRKGIFIMTSIDTKKRVVEHGLYNGYRDDCTRRCGEIDLDPPRMITGRAEDVL